MLRWIWLLWGLVVWYLLLPSVHCHLMPAGISPTPSADPDHDSVKSLMNECVGPTQMHIADKMTSAMPELKPIPVPGFKLGTFNAGGIWSQIQLGIHLIFGFFAASCSASGKLGHGLLTFSCFCGLKAHFLTYGTCICAYNALVNVIKWDIVAK